MTHDLERFRRSARRGRAAGRGDVFLSASALIAVLVFAGCKAPPARTVGSSEAPPAVGESAVAEGAVATTQAVEDAVDSVAELRGRPGHSFDEAELGRYIAVLHDEEPDAALRAVHLGRKNLGQPYEIYLLGEYPFEMHDPDPIYCLSKSDCLTFCEHVYAAALSRDWWGYLRALQRLRYREGVVGMLTRNHYTEADWNPNNEFLFEDMTTRLAGGRCHVPLTEVVRRARFFAKFGIGQDVPDEPFEGTFIPKARIPEVLSELRAGDMVNIVRGDAQSQWVGHTGLIAIGDAGAVNFLHAAQPVVREQPLVEYVEGNARCVGIKILRLRPDAHKIMEDTLARSAQATPVGEAALRAALAKSPLELGVWAGALPSAGSNGWVRDWKQAMRLQSYRLTHETPVDSALQAALERLDREVAAKFGIGDADRAFGVLDLETLRFAAVRPDEEFYGASVPKIAIVLAYFEKFPEKADALDSQTANELGLVLKRSDNELAAKYSQMVGLDFIQQTLQSERYAFYDAKHGGGLWCGKHYGIDEPRLGDPLKDHSHAATVRQCLRYYLMLEQGRLVSPAASATIKRLFASPRLEFHDDRFVRGLAGRGVTILRTSGEWEDWHLDTARVQHGGRVYLIAGMTKHVKGAEYLEAMAGGVDGELVQSFE